MDDFSARICKITKKIEEIYSVKQSKSDTVVAITMMKGFPVKKNPTSDLVHVINDLLNRFLDESGEHNILTHPWCLGWICSGDSTNSEYFRQGAIYKEVFIDCTYSIHDPIKKSVLLLFSRPQPHIKAKQTEIVSLLKCDVSLLFTCML